METSNSVHSSVAHLRSGRKNQWLRLNRELVLSYLHDHGADATMAYFKLERGTYERFLSAKQPKFEGLSASERALSMSKDAIEIAREAHRGQVAIEDRLDAMEPVIAVGRAVLAAVAQGVMEQVRLERLGSGRADVALNDFGKSGQK